METKERLGKDILKENQFKEMNEKNCFTRNRNF